MKNLKLFKNIIINLSARLISPFFKKDYNMWIFAFDDGGGSSLCENCWFLYQYVSKNNPDIKTFYISKNENNIIKLRRLSGKLVKPNTFQMFRLILKAGVYICEQNMDKDFVNFLKKKTLKVNLWHGMIIKKIGYASPLMMERKSSINKNKSLKRRIIDKLIGVIDYKDYDFLPCTSISMVEPMQKTFKNNNVFVVGQPRDDYFFLKNDRLQILKSNNIEFASKKKIITYLPTFRDTSRSDIEYLLFEKNEKLLNKLGIMNTIIFQKNHSYDGKSKKINDNMYVLDSKMSTQEILFLTDILITDYSSLFIDFLHLDKPIIFYPYDIDNYTKYDRELYFDYYSPTIFPGPKVKNEKELFNAINTFCDDESNYLDERRSSKNFFHKYNDGNSSKRTFTEISKVIKHLEKT